LYKRPDLAKKYQRVIDLYASRTPEDWDNMEEMHIIQWDERNNELDLMLKETYKFITTDERVRWRQLCGDHVPSMEKMFKSGILGPIRVSTRKP
jgi:hypothetical protein